MTKVDSKGRIVLPHDVRERLGIDPGTEVEIREEEGKAVVEPEDDPDQIIDDIERLIEAATRGDQAPYDELGVHEKSHVDTIRQQANETETSDE
jgi:AbrB family looped-hinge helix DNA binding protein